MHATIQKPIEEIVSYIKMDRRHRIGGHTRPEKEGCRDDGRIYQKTQIQISGSSYHAPGMDGHRAGYP